MYKKHIKRIIDFIFALMLLVMVLPIIALCGIIIKLEDRGPIFYLGNRLGKNKTNFKMYKLRSMKVNAPDIRNTDGSTFNSDDDPRFTKIGKIIRKTSIDELPQIINVLIGNMSFIGPRPDLPEHINYYEGEEVRKLEVLPGISGYNQAYFRNSAEWKERLKNDVYYVDNISLWLDLKIFFKTIESIILKKGIYVSTQSENLAIGKENGQGIDGNSESFECFSLDWDTEYFGVESARVNLTGNITEENQKKILEYCASFKFITILNIGNIKENNEWLGKNTKAFLTDMNIQFLKNIKDEPILLDKLTEVYNAYPRNEKIIEISETAFLYSRFYNDSALPKKQAKEIYKHWTECAFKQDNKYFVITRRNEIIAGYILFSQKKEEKSATIELIAVDENFRGQNVGKSLIYGMESFLLNNNIDHIKVGTQVNNVIAIQFYISCGFHYVGCGSVYHLWN